MCALRTRNERGGTSRSEAKGALGASLTFQLSQSSQGAWGSLPYLSPFPIQIFFPVSGTPKGAELSHLFKRSDEEMCFSNGFLERLALEK